MGFSVKDPVQKGDLVAVAWEQYAPAATFGGMTLAEYKAVRDAAKGVDSEIVSLKSQGNAKREERKTKRTTLSAATGLVVNDVRGTPPFGADSPIYAAMGYVPDSLKKTGKTNKKKPAGNN